MDMFSWTRKEAVLYNGIILAAIGLESIIVFLVVKVISGRYAKALICLKKHFPLTIVETT